MDPGTPRGHPSDPGDQRLGDQRERGALQDLPDLLPGDGAVGPLLSRGYRYRAPDARRSAVAGRRAERRIDRVRAALRRIRRHGR